MQFTGGHGLQLEFSTEIIAVHPRQEFQHTAVGGVSIAENPH